MTEGTMNKYPSTVTGKTVEQIAEEYRKDLKSKFFLSEPQLDLACQGFKDGYRECEKEWQEKADYLKGKKE